MKKKFDVEAAKRGEEVITESGRKARIICFDRKSKHFPLIVLIEHENGTEFQETMTRNGYCYPEEQAYQYNLKMAPKKMGGWVNIYPESTFYSTKEEARKTINHGAIATVKIEWEE